MARSGRFAAPLGCAFHRAGKSGLFRLDENAGEGSFIGIVNKRPRLAAGLDEIRLIVVTIHPLFTEKTSAVLLTARYGAGCRCNCALVSSDTLSYFSRSWYVENPSGVGNVGRFQPRFHM